MLEKIEKLVEQTVVDIKKDVQSVPPTQKVLKHRVTPTFIAFTDV